MLFNEQQKRAFIRDTARTVWARETYTAVLERIGVIESRFNTDASEMERDLLRKEIAETNIIPPDERQQHSFVLDKYVRWVNRDKDTSRIKADDTPSVERLVRNPKHMEMTLEHVFPNPEINSINHVYRSYLWLAFCGLKEEEAACLESWNLNFDTMKIQYGGREYPIYREAAYDLRSVCAMNTICENVGKKRVVLKDKPRAKGPLILRGPETEKPLIDVIHVTYRTAVSRAFKKAEDRDLIPKSGICYGLTYTNAFYSGLFYRMRELEELGFKPDFSEAVEKHYQDFSKKQGYHTSKDYTENDIRNRRRNDFLYRYESWKAGFGIK